jgi:PST family polysaccharide transporter
VPTSDRPSLTRTALAGTLWTASGFGAISFSRLVFGVVIARLLGPKTIGIYAAALVVTRVSNLLGNIGIGPALVQRKELDSAHIRSAFTLSILLSSLTGGMVWLVAPLFAQFFRMPQLEDAIRLLAVVFPLRGFALVPQALLQRNLEFRLLAATSASSYLIGYGLVGVVLAWLGFGLRSLIIATICHATLELGLLLGAQPFTKVPAMNRNAIKDLLRFGSGIALSSVLGFFATQGDRLITGRVLGDISLGLYSRAQGLMATTTNLFSKIGSTALFPLVSKVQSSRERLLRAYRTGLSLTGLCVLPLSVLLAVLAPELIHTLLGPAWAEAALPFRILSLFLLFRTADKLAGPVIMASGAVFQLAWIQGVYALLVLAGAALGVRWGVSGVATGVAVAILGHSLLLVWLCLRLTGGHWTVPLDAWLRPSVLALATGLGSGLLTFLLRSSAFDPLPIVAIVSIATALTWLAALLTAPRLLVGKDNLLTLGQLPLPKIFKRVLLPGEEHSGETSPDS